MQIVARMKHTRNVSALADVRVIRGHPWRLEANKRYGSDDMHKSLDEGLELSTSK